MFTDLISQLMGLAGFAALVVLLVNVLKSVGIVKDGSSDLWSAGFNLAGLVALYLLKVFQPDFDVGGVDEDVMTFVNAVTPLVSYILMLLSSKLSYFAVRGIPILGKSYSK